MTKKATVVSRLVFPAVARADVLAAFLSLPGDMRPTHHRFGERGRRNLIDDPSAFRTSMLGGQSFYLVSQQGTYSFNPNADLPIDCSAYRILPASAHDYLAHMAGAGAIFGYCCADEEEMHRHYLRVEVKSGVMSAYYGRDIDRYIPGLYWLTLVSERLLEKHGVPIGVLENIALEHADLGGGIHLFRFYDRPEDWTSSTAINEVLQSVPGFFDLRKVRAGLTPGVDFEELARELRPWD
jgi:hypothetical protein